MSEETHTEVVPIRFEGIPEGFCVEPIYRPDGDFGFQIVPVVPDEDSREDQTGWYEPDSDQQARKMDQEATTAWLNTPLIDPDVVSENGEDMFPDELEQAHKEQAQNKPLGGDLEDGYYYIDNHDSSHDPISVYKVVTSQSSGRPYAKTLDTQTGKFEYSPGIMPMIKAEASPLDLETAKKYGALYGRCMICGRTLTDEVSIANGIGPICAERI